LATFFFTALSWFFIEKPIMERKDRKEGRADVERLSLSEMASWFSWLPWSRAKRSRPAPDPASATPQ
jgi:peptidoglycan/LPS O-acetylase OafA/YrhL